MQVLDAVSSIGIDHGADVESLDVEQPVLAIPLVDATPDGCPNTHPMVTRSKLGIHKPKVYMTAREPELVIEALQVEHWKTTIRDEYVALLRSGTWSLVTLPHDGQAIGCKWVYKVKKKKKKP